jgi:hypothetical protein
MVEEGAELRGYLIVRYVVKMQGTSQKIANTTKWQEN